MNNLKPSFKKIILAVFVMSTLAISMATKVSAASSFSVSPMYQMISLTPGETYVGNFAITNPGDNLYDFYYELRVEPFTVDESDRPTLTANGDYNRIVDWIEIPSASGLIAPNNTAEARFIIHVPEDAPAGGQYASIVVSSGEYRVDNSSVDLQEVYQTAHLLYADVAGETVRKGTITDVSVPGFLFSGNISGSVNIHNEGNVHSRATQTLQIYPIFSSEEAYTNEENPKETWVMPEKNLYDSVAWKETPSVGIFHVIYNVEYEGVESKVDKIVIVCPIWLLFLILLAIFLIVFRILSVKKRSNHKD